MKIHVVKKGETLQGIARSYALDERALLLANALPLSGPLCPGQSLLIPGDFPCRGKSFELLAFPSSAIEPAAAAALTYLCPYSHRFDAEGTLILPDFHCHIPAVRQEGCAPLLCLANLDEEGSFSPELAHRLFTRPQLKEKLLDALVTKLKANGYYGLQLCFNYLFPFDKDNYSAFAAELAPLLHREGLCLSLELAPPDSPALSAALDYAALGHEADRLSLMFCRWAHAYSPPQPLAPLPYIRAGLERICALIPPQKLLLGLSGAGFDWQLPWTLGDRAQQFPNALAVEKAMALGLEIKYDERAQCPYYDYTDPAARRHRLYFEDARSTEAKLRLAEEYALAGFSLYSWDSALRPGGFGLGQLSNPEKLL